MPRVDVDAADDEHVVGAAGEPCDATAGSPARAVTGQEPGDIAGAVPDDRLCLFGERRDHQLALTALRNRLAGRRVDDLGEEVVLEHVQTAGVLAALGRHAGPHHLGQAIDVARRIVVSPRLLDPRPQLLRPHLRTVDPPPEADLLTKAGCSTRSARRRENDGVEASPVAPVSASSPIWNPGFPPEAGTASPRADAVVQPEPSREEPVAVRHVHDVAAVAPTADNERALTSPAMSPVYATIVGVPDARGGVDPHDIGIGTLTIPYGWAFPFVGERPGTVDVRDLADIRGRGRRNRSRARVIGALRLECVRECLRDDIDPPMPSVLGADERGARSDTTVVDGTDRPTE